MHTTLCIYNAWLLYIIYYRQMLTAYMVGASLHEQPKDTSGMQMRVVDCIRYIVGAERECGMSV